MQEPDPADQPKLSESPVAPESEPEPSLQPDQPPPQNPEKPAEEVAQSSPVVTEPLAGIAKPAKNGKKQILLFAGLILLVLAALTAFLLLRTDNQAQKPASTTAQKKDISLFKVEYFESEIPKYPVSEQGYGADVNIASQMFEGLVQYQDQSKLVPLLAASWTNPDQTTWLFNLKPNIKFHTGRTMTADDVKYTFDYIIAHKDDTDSIYANVSSLDTIKSVEVTKPNQVKITTNEPDPLLLGKISFIGIVDSKAAPGSYDAGTGPYVVKQGTTPSDTDIDLTAAANYWGGHVYTKELKFHLETDLAQIKKDIAANSYDLTGNLTSSSLKLFKVPYAKVDVPDPGGDYLVLNTNRAGSPLQSLAARQAVEYAIDKQAFITASGGDAQLANQIVPISLPGHNPAIKTTPYDAAKAKQLLSTVKNSGAQITLACVVNDKLCQAIAADLTAAGFKVKTLEVSDTDAFDSGIANGDYDIAFETTSSGTVDGLDLLESLLTGGKNYDNTQVDDLLTQTGTTYDQAKRIQLMQQVATIVDNEKPVVALDYGNSLFVLTKKSAVLKVDQPAFAGSVYFWKAYQK